jgi:hypothetical protein
MQDKTSRFDPNNRSGSTHNTLSGRIRVMELKNTTTEITKQKGGRIGPKELDISGKRFGRLVALNRTGTAKKCNPVWSFVCDCGTVSSITKCSVTSGKTMSCGCLNSEESRKRVWKAREAQIKHMLSDTKSYTAWRHMIQRCNNPKNREFKNYGARGIQVCDRWLKFYNFYQDMGDAPQNLSLERVDNMMGYSPDNCTWATAKEQARNSRHTKLNPEKVKFIRDQSKLGISNRDLALYLGVHVATIIGVVKGKQWNDV